MTFVKNKFSYVLWACYIVLIGFAYFGLAVSGLQSLSITDKSAIICISCLPLFLVAGLFALIRWCVGRYTAARTPVQASAAFEAIAVGVLLVTGVVIRALMLNAAAALCVYRDICYFEGAKVTGQVIPLRAQSMEYFYYVLLRGVFYVVGNHFTAGFVLQIVLQTFSSLVWYFALKKLIGRIGAFFFLITATVFPFFVNAGLQYSPEVLYTLLYGLVLLLIGFYYEKERESASLKWQNALLLLASGLGIGFLAYLDAIGLSLISLLVFVKFLKKNRPDWLDENGEKESFALHVLLLAVGYLAGKGLFMMIDVWQNHSSLQRIMGSWIETFGPKGSMSLYELSTSVTGKDALWVIIVLLLLMLGIPSFFLKKESENQLIWVVFAAVIALFCFFKVETPAMDYGYLLFHALVVLLAAGMQNLFYVPGIEQTVTVSSAEKTESSRISDDAPVRTVTDAPVRAAAYTSGNASTSAAAGALTGIFASAAAPVEKEKPVPAKPQMPAGGSNDRYRQPENGEKEIKYIENPLPLPKKHEKKSMGYKIDVPPEKMKYDIQVSDTDDFDIK